MLRAGSELGAGDSELGLTGALGICRRMWKQQGEWGPGWYEGRGGDLGLWLGCSQEALARLPEALSLVGGVHHPHTLPASWSSLGTGLGCLNAASTQRLFVE